MIQFFFNFWGRQIAGRSNSSNNGFFPLNYSAVEAAKPCRTGLKTTPPPDEAIRIVSLQGAWKLFENGHKGS